ncbi:GtrA family protein [Thalassorhabdomicrobium marinisediminis]|uniref:GtrA family protein n=1 Tax=Thalassorhabdomicrobium marinisediminis TaxID=2170577 RepID=UPI00248FBB63|nr:GtrA family protein [Thalassorhabdomicrobium marinisediminis]
MTSAAIVRPVRETPKQVGRYIVTGAINTALGLIVILCLHIGLGVGLIASNAVGYAVGLICSFALNRSWTFSSQTSILPAGLKYLVTVGIAFAVCIASVTGLLAAHTPYLIAQAIGTSIYSIIVFIGAKYVIFIN